jgi:hypothetical protein
MMKNSLFSILKYFPPLGLLLIFSLGSLGKIVFEKEDEKFLNSPDYDFSLMLGYNYQLVYSYENHNYNERIQRSYLLVNLNDLTSKSVYIIYCNDSPELITEDGGLLEWIIICVVCCFLTWLVWVKKVTPDTKIF